MTPFPTLLGLVLHAHLPFVRHPEHEDFLEERWLFEAVLECYLPLLEVLDGLLRDGVPHRVALSVSPTLGHMLTDPLLLRRLGRHLEKIERFLVAESQRPEVPETTATLLRFYRDRTRRMRRAFVETHGGHLISSLRRLASSGSVELVATAATHAFLPLLIPCPPAVRAQIRVGIAEHQRLFGEAPRTFWLPECGYDPALDDALTGNGIDVVVLEGHGLITGTPAPEMGIRAPVQTPRGLLVVSRDTSLCKLVWDAQMGYPGNAHYREFHRDVGYDLPPERLHPLAIPTGEPSPTGIKLHRVTGPGLEKLAYDPILASATVGAHASHFLHHVAGTTSVYRSHAGAPPIALAAFDAELFGHWWFEGPQWLDQVLRQLAFEHPDLRAAGPRELLQSFPIVEQIEPAPSSWGAGGHATTWLAPENDWIVPQVLSASFRMAALVQQRPDARGLELRALNQALRELMLAQASDWPFLIARGTASDYALGRVHTHLGRFAELASSLEAGTVAAARVGELEATDNVFPTIDYRVFA